MAKDSSRITAGELQKKVEFRRQKTFKKKDQTAPTSPHVVREGFKKKIKKRKCFHQKTISSIFSCQTRLELQMGLVSTSDVTKKIAF